MLALFHVDLIEQRQSSIEEAAGIFETMLNTITESSNRSLLWIEYMFHARRHQGLAAARGVFSRARKDALCQPSVFAASALMEVAAAEGILSRAGEEALSVAGRIFDLGMSRWPEDVPVAFIREHLQLLLRLNDEKNARVLFERVIRRESTDDGNEQATNGMHLLPIWQAYVGHIARYGDRNLLWPLERRMRLAFPRGTPECAPLSLFYNRHAFADLLPVTAPADQSRAVQNLRALPWHVHPAIAYLIDTLPRSLADLPAANTDLLMASIRRADLRSLQRRHR